MLSVEPMLSFRLLDDCSLPGANFTIFFFLPFLSERNIANDCLPIVYANFLTKTKDERSGTNENQKHKKKKETIVGKEETLRKHSSPFVHFLDDQRKRNIV